VTLTSEPVRIVRRRIVQHAIAQRLIRPTGERAHGLGIGTPLVVMLLVVFAGYAAVVAVATSGAESVWGAWAASGYGTAAVLAGWYWRRRPGLTVLVAIAGALAVPAAILPNNLGPTSEVRVVARAAALWLSHGTPYLPTAQLVSWRAYDPYMPGMSLFGLPHALGVLGPLGDPLLWLALTTFGALAAACCIAGGAAPRCPGCWRQALLRALFLVACPVFALPMSLGVTDPPVIALVCLGLAWIARRARSSRSAAATGAWDGAAHPGAPLSRTPRDHGRPLLAGVPIGAACALKAIAWPAFPIIFALVAVRDGRRAAAQFAASSTAVFLALTFATAPRLFAHPVALWQNLVEYPLGLSPRPTPAASPLPGHVLAEAGSFGHFTAIVLLVAAVLAVAVSLLVRPPRDVTQASLRLAVGLTAMFLLAPNSRFGYFAYPVAILAWLALCVTIPRRAAHEVRGAGEGASRSRPLRT